MILTKQLQVVIESSLAQGRDYDDIREILMKQGFQDADINELFSQYRGGAVQAQQPKVSTDTDLGLMKPQAATPPVMPAQTPKEQLFNKDFVHPEVKPGFVPVGFEQNNSPQSEIKDEVKTFMNVGTDTQTAANMVAKEQELPAPGTAPLPNEIAATPVVETKRDPSQKYINVGFGGMPEMEKVMAEEQAKKIEKSPWPLLVVLIILLMIFGGIAYAWFFIFRPEVRTLTDEEKFLQELQQSKEQENIPAPEPTGPRDPFTNQLLETN